MDEQNTKKLHPIAEILIIAVITFLCNYIFDYISVLLKFLCPVIAALLCMKAIEKRKIDVWKIVLIALCISIIVRILESSVIIYIISIFKINLLAFSYVRTFLEPVLEAILIVVLVNVFEASNREEHTRDIKMHFNLDLHILLLIFSLGIWRLIWIYRITQYLNCVKEQESRNPAANLILCMLVPFYSVFWAYKSAERIDMLAKSEDVKSDLTTVCLICEIFIPIIPPILMQDKVNKIIEKVSK